RGSVRQHGYLGGKHGGGRRLRLEQPILLWDPGIAMAIAVVASVKNTPAIDGNTTGAIDTTGATLLVMHAAYYVAPSSVSDSYGNTWVSVIDETGSPHSQMWYVANPIVGPGHTFTISGIGLFQCMQAAAFSSVATTSPLDQFDGNSNPS